MIDPLLSDIIERGRWTSPVSTPQALASGKEGLWISSRDERRLICVDPQTFTVREDVPTPGIVWAAVPVGNVLYVTLGEGKDDDRYTCRFVPGSGFDEFYRVPQPDLTGSYLSHDAEHLYLSQWYKHRVLQLDAEGKIVRSIDIGAEISGHVFVDGLLYVLRGTEEDGENWRIGRLNLKEDEPRVKDLARVPFQCRSLVFDGRHFWSNFRAGNATICFDLPAK